MAVAFLGFAWDVEATSKFISDDIERLRIITKAAHVQLDQDSLVVQEHGKVWGVIHTSIKLAQS